MLKNKKKLIFFVTSLTLLVLLLAGTIFFLVSKVSEDKIANQENVKNEIYAAWQNSIKGSNYDPRALANQIEDLLNKNKNLSPDNEGAAELVLGDSYSAFDLQKGSDILKGIIANDKYSNIDRAQAILILSDNYDYFQRDSFYINNVFTGDYFGKFIQNNNVPLAFERLNEFADQLYPNVISEYRIARFWSEKSLADSADQKSEDLKQANQYLNKANSTFSLVDLNNWWTDMSQKGLAYRLQGQTLENLYFSFENNTNNIELSDSLVNGIRDSYQKSIATLEDQSSGNIYMKFFSYYSRFYYASFLSKVDSNKYSNEIKQVLAPVDDSSASKDLHISKFLSFEKNNNGSPENQAIGRLSEIDPNFKQLIDGLNN